jgi:hypothetical protein
LILLPDSQNSVPVNYNGLVEKGIHRAVRSLVEALNFALFIRPDRSATLYFYDVLWVESSI